MRVCFGVIVRVRIKHRCACVASVFLCASRPVIPAFVMWLWRGVPHPVLAFLTGSYPVGCVGRIHYIRWISGGQGQALSDQSGRPCSFLNVGLLCLSYPWV